jgi:hypothetical protein
MAAEIDVQGVAHYRAPVRGTQSFVGTLGWCWKRPSLTALEILWRWAWGLPFLWIVFLESTRILDAAPLNRAALAQMSLVDPMRAAATLSDAVALLLPGVLGVVRWLAPLAALAWVVAAGLGRTAVLRRAEPALHARPVTLMVLYGIRLAALAASFAAWFAVLRWDAATTVVAPMAAGQEPSVVLYAAIAIVATLTLFSAWAVVSWGFSAAPLVAMRENTGVWVSLHGAMVLKRDLRSKLVEVNLVMGIVKIAVIVLAMVLSACPLPFEAIATPEFMRWWYALTTVVYFIGSDFFHVVHLVGYLRLWSAVDEAL